MNSWAKLANTPELRDRFERGDVKRPIRKASGYSDCECGNRKMATAEVCRECHEKRMRDDDYLERLT